MHVQPPLEHIHMYCISGSMWSGLVQSGSTGTVHGSCCYTHKIMCHFLQANTQRKALQDQLDRLEVQCTCTCKNTDMVGPDKPAIPLVSSVWHATQL